MFEMIMLNLQFHSDAGNLVNATGNYVNAYTGETTAFDSTNTLAAEIKTFYDTELLENSRVEQKYAQFGKKVTLPEGHGPTMEWRKWNTFPRAESLTEGVIPTGKKFGMSYKTATINQFGLYTAVSDKLELRAYDDVIGGAVEEMGASAAESQEALIRNALLSNDNVMYCDNITLATGEVASTPNTPGTMLASTTARSMFTPAMVAKAVTKLKKDRVPTINGDYVCVIHPSVAEDLRNNKDWLNAHIYAAPEELFNGEIGRLHSVRFVENCFAPVLGGTNSSAYANHESTKTYASYFFGKDAFGIIDPAGGNLQMIVHDKDEIGGPLNQFSTIKKLVA